MKLNLSPSKQVDASKLEERKARNESAVFMKSKFHFLNDHFGLRPGCIHVVLAGTGGGKSTVALSLISEMLLEDKKILVYSTEEHVEDYETKFGYHPLSRNLERLSIFHEQDLLKRISNKTDDPQAFINQIEFSLIESKPDVFILDNITTSLFYDQNKRAVEVAMGLKTLCDSFQIPFVIAAHTAASVRQNTFFDSSQVRGFRSIVNTAQYVYCLIRLITEEMGITRSAAFIYTDKSRNHDRAARAFYRLWYDPDTKLYSGDEKSDYAKFKKMLRSV